MLKPTIKVQIGSTTVRFVGATILTGVKPDHQIKRDTEKKPTTRRDWVEVKSDANDV